MNLETNSMLGINGYGRELTQAEIDKKIHRHFVGAMWEEIGILQFDFLVGQGLKPCHRLLDIGCGCLRGGLHFIRYLNEGNYYGLDVNSSLIRAGRIEIKEAGLEYKRPELLVNDKFRIEKFNTEFDFMVSVSLFTHLPMDIIIRCLSEVKKYLKPTGAYFSTIFEAPESAHIDNLKHQPGGVVTNYNSDPFHYSFEEISHAAETAGLEAKLYRDWNHPRNQKMVIFTQGACQE